MTTFWKEIWINSQTVRHATTHGSLPPLQSLRTKKGMVMYDEGEKIGKTKNSTGISSER